MSLQVWLPMTKDLRQQGLSSVTIVNNGATFNSSGKLGGCYSFGTGDSYITIDSTPLKTFTEFSFACWVKIISWNTSYSTIFAAKNSTSVSWNNLIFSLLRNSSNSTLCFNISNGSNYTSTYCQTGTLSLNTWYHITCTYKSGEIKLYQNGNVVSTYKTTVVPNFNSIVNLWIGKSNASSYQSNNLMNDVRIYDHCLSPMEVKRISQGLVLHYPLNSNSTYTSLVDKNSTYNPYNNFGADVTYTLTTTGESYNGSSVRRLTATINNSTRISSFKTDLWSHGVYGWRTTFKANTKYVFWIYYKPVTHTDIRVGGTASNIAGWTEISPEYVGNGWYRVGQYRSGAVTSDKTDSIFTSFTWQSAAVNTPISIDFACPTLVEGLTEIQPSINYNEGNMVYDTSGYCNNADVIGVWNTTSDTPKYSSSMHLSTTSSKIHISNFSTSGFGNSYSFAWWGKRDSNSPMFWGFSDGIRLNGMYVGTLWNTGDGSNNPIYKPGTTTTITAPSVNTWHHYVMTGDGTTCKLYLDGELYGQAKTYKAISGTSIYINGWDSSTTYCSNDMSMSDFRIYATALSADDVKSLYQNTATIDADGTIHGAIR